MKVMSTGAVHWVPPAIYITTCQVNVLNYPFDDQTCPLTMGSWVTPTSEMNITLPPTRDTEGLDSIDTTYVANTEWELIGFPCVQHSSVYSCCSNSSYMVITCSIKVKRMYMFYVRNLALPCLLLLVIGSLSFCLPAESGERVTLSVTVLLAMTVFVILMVEKLPPTSKNIPLMGKYSTSLSPRVSLSMTVLLAVIVVIILMVEKFPPTSKNILLMGKYPTSLCHTTNHEITIPCTLNVGWLV